MKREPRASLTPLQLGVGALCLCLAAFLAPVRPVQAKDASSAAPSGDAELARLNPYMLAGETASPTPTVSPEDAEPEQDKAGVCDWYKSMGKLYTDAEDPLLQSFYVNGRFQYQAAYVDGKAGDDHFSYRRDEVRRFYLGTGLQAFEVVELSGQAVLFRDNLSEREFRFEHMWDLMAKFDVKRAFEWGGIDSFKLGYGSREVRVSEEWNVSSKNIKTIERSAISNKIWPSNRESSNPTGVFVEWAKDNLSSTAGIFSTTTNDWWANWTDGELYYLEFLYDYTGYSRADRSELLWAVFYQDVTVGEQALADGVEWATSLATRYGRDPWTVRIDGIVGGNGDTTGDGNVQDRNRRGPFWGVVLLPTVWLWQDKIEGVGRYQYEGSRESQGIRLNSRYVRTADDALESITLPYGGRGDQHHSFYLGSNVYLCGDNAKFMFGAEYDYLRSRSQDVFSGWTFAVAFRTFF